MEDFEGETRYAKYDHFRIGDEETKYRLSLGLYSGTAGKIVSYNHSSINVFISFVKGFYVLTLDHLPVHVRWKPEEFWASVFRLLSLNSIYNDVEYYIKFNSSFM